jgi:hypothetical protein
MGAGGGSGKSRSSDIRGGNLEPWVRQFEGETRGVRQSMFDQMNEALTTGGIGARVPIVQNATTQMLNSQGRAMSDTQRQLGQAGLGSTPFGQRAMGEQRMQGAQQVAGIGPQYASQAGQAGGQGIFGIMQSILGSMATQGKGNASSKQGQGQAQL